MESGQGGKESGLCQRPDAYATENYGLTLSDAVTTFTYHVIVAISNDLFRFFGYITQCVADFFQRRKARGFRPSSSFI